MTFDDRKIELTAVPDIHDAGAIKLGGAFRLPPEKPVMAEIADQGRIRLGGAFRLASA